MSHEIIQPEKLVLASSSPRRAQLLEQAGYQFSIQPPDDNAECGICSGETPPEFVARMAFQKAQNVANRYESGVYIGCDTVAEVNGQILGKPVDRSDARRMLMAMSGKRHRVFSGLCLWWRPDNKQVIRVESTDLFMDELNETLLEDYLDSEEWIGKAGAFGYQDGLDWVRIENGNESNVVGLPIELLASLLSDFH